MSSWFQDTFVDFLAAREHPLIPIITTGISHADWSADSGLQTAFLTIVVRGKHQIDNGPHLAAGRRNDMPRGVRGAVVTRRMHVLETPERTKA
jgi:hypothetical protein